MTIQLYLNNEEETHIYSMYDMSANPFKIGDIINISVSDIPPVRLKAHSPEFSKKLVEENNRKINMFHNKEIKLVLEGKYINIESNSCIIEYHCELVHNVNHKKLY